MLNIISGLTIILYSLLYAKYYFLLALIPFIAFYLIRAMVKIELSENHLSYRSKIIKEWNDNSFVTFIQITFNLTRICIPIYIIYEVTNKYFGILAN